MEKEELFNAKDENILSRLIQVIYSVPFDSATDPSIYRIRIGYGYPNKR
jgi:hypothetical protein